MKRYPYERFLRFLVSRKLDVNRTLERLGLPRAGDLWLVECRQKMRKSVPAALRQYLESPDSESLSFRDGVLEWAEGEGFRQLWEMQSEFGSAEDPDFDAAWSLFSHPTSRGVMGMLLLSRSTDKEIIEIARDHLYVTLTDAQLALYRSLFWDIAQIERTAWTSFAGILKTQDEANYISFGMGAPTANEVRDILNMDVAAVDHRSMMNQIISKSYNAFKRAMESSNPEAHDAKGWAELTLKAIGAARANGGLGTAEAETMSSADRFRKMFSVEPGRVRPPSLSELVGEVGKPEKKELSKAGK